MIMLRLRRPARHQCAALQPSRGWPPRWWQQAHRSGVNNPGGAGRRAFLTPERVTHRYNTLIDAFNTADRKQRGHLPYDRILEIYALYFHNSVGQLQDEELTGFVEKFARHAGDGTIVVEYPRLADALRKRDLEMMAKAEARALRQTGAGGGGLSFHTPERPSPGGGGGASGGGRLPYNPLSRGGGVAAALRMVDEQTNQTSPPRPAMQGGMQGRPRPPPFADLGGMGGPTEQLPGDAGRERGVGGPQAYAPSATSPVYGGGAQQSPTLEQGGGFTLAASPGVANGLSPMQSMQYVGQAAAGSLQELLRACEHADEERGGMHGAQLLTCCRMQGIPESSSMLRDDHDGAADDGRVDYVKFVQQLAAHRARRASIRSRVQSAAAAAVSAAIAAAQRRDQGRPEQLESDQNPECECTSR